MGGDKPRIMPSPAPPPGRRSRIGARRLPLGVMKRYANASGHSGVTAYEMTQDGITVKFRDGHVYRYTHASAGRDNVERMKQLAAAGRGLSTFINRNMRDRHADKLA